MSFKKFLMLLALPVAFMVSSCEDVTPNTDSILPECEIVDATGAAINTINLPAEQSEATFTITANRAWSAAVTLVDWFAVTPYSQPNPENKSISTEVKITAFANTSTESRSAVIDITVDGVPTPIKLTVNQLGVGQVATGKTIYYDNFDKVIAVQDSNNYWPYMSAEYGNPTPENQTGVTYESKNVTARANSGSNSDYSDYEGSGGNNMFFGKENHLTISGISLAELEGNAMTITFGTEKYSKDNGSVFTPSEFHVYISGDNGAKWSEISYTYAGTAEGRWNVATARFSLKEVPATLAIKFVVDVASSYRMDDLTILEGGGGTEIDLSQGGNGNGGDNSVINPDPNAQAISVADFIAKADSNTTYQLTGVISGNVNTTYGNFDLVDDSGSIYIYGLKDGSTGQNLNWTAKGLKKGDTITIQGKYYLYEKDGNTKHEIVDALYISHVAGEGGDPEPPVVVDGDFGSDAAFVCASDDSTNAAYGLGDTQIGGKPASGFKLGKSKQEGKFTSAAIGVSGDKYLNFYAVSWGAGGDKTIYFRVNGGEVKSQAIKANAGATGNAPYNNLAPTEADHYSILLSGLTATDKIEFSTNADFALTAHAGTGNDYASRVIFFGVKLTDEAISGSTGGDNTGGDNTGGDNTGGDNTGGSTGEIQTLTVKDFLAKGVDANVWYKLTGKITNIANTTFGNFDLVDESGSVYVYGLTATQQSSNDKSFSSLGLKEGDIVTLIGVRAVYNDSPQVGNAYYVSHVEGETPEVDGNVATISFADAANRTTLTKTQQVWQQNGITVTGDKASSTTDVADYSGPARFYKGSNLTIAAEKEMSQIVINTTGGSKYYFTLSDGSGYTVSGSGTSKATITLTTPAKSFTITGLANQVRCTSIEVTFAE